MTRSGKAFLIVVAAVSSGAAAPRTWILGCTKTPTIATYSTYRACDDAARKHERDTGHDSGCR